MAENKQRGKFEISPKKVFVLALGRSTFIRCSQVPINYIRTISKLIIASIHQDSQQEIFLLTGFPSSFNSSSIHSGLGLTLGILIASYWHFRYTLIISLYKM
jgi:hypothetical protein